MKLTCGELLIQELRSVEYWVKEFKNILEGNFTSDGTLTKGQYKALCIKKMENHKNACLYLDTLPKDFIIHTGVGYGEEYEKFQSIVNR